MSQDTTPRQSHWRKQLESSISFKTSVRIIETMNYALQDNVEGWLYDDIDSLTWEEATTRTFSCHRTLLNALEEGCRALHNI